MPTKDVTVDIPLNPVTSRVQTQKSAGSQDRYGQQGPDEKAGLFHRYAGRRKIKRVSTRGTVRTNANGEEEVLTRMGRIYNKIRDFSVFTRYFLYVLPLALLISVPIVIGATAAKRARLGHVRILWLFTWVEVVWLSLWVSKLLAHYLPSVFQFLCGIVSSGTRKYALVIKALEIPLSLTGWALVAFVTFKRLMNLERDPRASEASLNWISVVNNILAAALIASLIFLAEKCLVQIISINYHRTQFNSKIKDSKRDVYLLGILYDASTTLFPAYCNEFAEEDYLINDSIAAGAMSKGSHRRSGSATPMKLIHDIGRVGDKITAAFGNIAHEVTGKEVFNPTAAHSVVVEALEKAPSSEALAKRLWMSFVVEGKEALYREDLVEVLGAQREQEAEGAFDAIDKDANGDISLDEMIMAVVEIGRERHSIANSMHDVDQAIHVLDKLLCTVVFVIIIFVFVGFLNASFTTTLATAGTALLSMSFIFASTAAEVLGSCIFLFVKHPFDVGDRVDITGESLIVEHISLLFSVFKRVDSQKMTQIPNTVLNSNWIDNVSRSKAMREQVKLYINFDTTFDDIQVLKNELQTFVRSKENGRDFMSDIEVEVIGIAEMNKLELKVEIRHKSNWSNETLRAARRSKFMCALVLALRKIPIYAPGGGDAVLGDVGKPSYSVAISDAEAAARRAEYAATKEGKRLFPSKPAEDKPDQSPTGKTSGTDYMAKGSSRSRSGTRPSTAGNSERTAVEALNVRNPAGDPARDDWDSYREEFNVGGTRRSDDDDDRRGNEIEEVRGLLRRESTRGKRRPGGGHRPSVSIIAEVQSTPTRQRSRSGTTQQAQGPPQQMMMQSSNDPARRPVPASAYQPQPLQVRPPQQQIQQLPSTTYQQYAPSSQSQPQPPPHGQAPQPPPKQERPTPGNAFAGAQRPQQPPQRPPQLGEVRSEVWHHGFGS
ncbi:MAG: hypothetical protein M1817_002923 [Caeruleum heppii]|nr:MAG: hypothetical protein M1817_002923 [Caeruleum heppii]